MSAAQGPSAALPDRSFPGGTLTGTGSLAMTRSVFALVLTALAGVLVVVSHRRAEEEAGRREPRCASAGT